jgi:hypothetical protein
MHRGRKRAGGLARGHGGEQRLGDHETGGARLMFDLAAIAIALGCFAFIFFLLFVLERV